MEFFQVSERYVDLEKLLNRSYVYTCLFCFQHFLLLFFSCLQVFGGDESNIDVDYYEEQVSSPSTRETFLSLLIGATFSTDCFTLNDGAYCCPYLPIYPEVVDGLILLNDLLK